MACSTTNYRNSRIIKLKRVWSVLLMILAVEQPKFTFCNLKN